MQHLRKQRVNYRRKAGMQVQAISQINCTGSTVANMSDSVGIAGPRSKLEERNYRFLLSSGSENECWTISCMSVSSLEVVLCGGNTWRVERRAAWMNI